MGEAAFPEDAGGVGCLSVGFGVDSLLPGAGENCFAGVVWPGDGSGIPLAKAASNSSWCCSKVLKQFLHSDFLQAWGSNTTHTGHGAGSSIAWPVITMTRGPERTVLLDTIQPRRQERALLTQFTKNRNKPC